MDKKLNEAVAALRPQMVAALQRLVRRRSVEADPLPGKPFGEEVLLNATFLFCKQSTI